MRGGSVVGNQEGLFGGSSFALRSEESIGVGWETARVGERKEHWILGRENSTGKSSQN